ncbi:MAG: hypothetical protein K5769_06725 [Pseudobutyrivibrio sp.]|nr:hypothetical protein [Pseudobutyrivibrio sp.]
MSIKVYPYPILNGVERHLSIVYITEDDEKHCFDFKESKFGFLAGFEVTFQTAKYELEEGKLVNFSPKARIKDEQAVKKILGEVIQALKVYYNDNINYYDGNDGFSGFYLNKFKPVVFVKPVRNDLVYLLANVEKQLNLGNRVSIGFNSQELETNPALFELSTQTNEEMISKVQKEIANRLRLSEGDNIIIDDITNIILDNHTLFFSNYVFEKKKINTNGINVSTNNTATQTSKARNLEELIPPKKKGLFSRLFNK